MEKLDFLELGSATQHIDIQLFTIYKLLREQFKFSVPHYQRAYKWRPEEINVLLHDIQTSQENNDSYYLIGPIVLIQPTSESDRHDIVDGQQRLTTLAFTLKIIQRRFSEILNIGLSQHGISADSDTAKKLIDLSSFLNSNFKSSPHSAMLIRFQRETHDESFEHYFDDSFAKEPEVDSMNSAIKTIKEFIESELTDAPSLINFVEHLLGKVCVAVIAVNRMDAAYSLFESLNHKGEKLRPIDLVRNSIFMYLDDTNISVCTERWNSLESLIQSIHNSRAVDSHIRDLFLTYFECKTGKPLEEKDIFSEVRNEFQSKTADTNFATFCEITDSKKNGFFAFYNMSVSSHASGWHSMFKGLSTHILDQIVSRKVFRSSVTACLHSIVQGRISAEMVVPFFEDLYSLIARTQVLGNIPVTKYSQIFAEFANKVFEGLEEDAFVKAATETITEACWVKPVVPDSSFIRDLTSNRNLAKDKAKWLLQDVEKLKIGRKSSQSIEMHISHIYPEEPGKKWPEFDAEASYMHLNTIGNFVLTDETQENRDLSFLDKSITYSSSSYRYTKPLGRKTSWSPKEAENRSRRLAKLAAEAWPINYLAE